MSRCSELPDAGLPGLVQLKLRSPHEVRATFWSEIKLLVILGVFFFCLVFSSDSHILPSPTPGPSTCLPNYYRCSSGACVMDSWVCDGYQDCADGSDEEGCPSPGECWPALCALEGAIVGTPWVQHGQAQCPLDCAVSGCFAPPKQGDWELDARGLIVCSCPLTFVLGKASHPAFHPGCGWATFASVSTGNYCGNYKGSVCVYSAPRGGSPIFLLASWRPSYSKKGKHCHLVAEYGAASGDPCSKPYFQRPG